MKRLSSLLGVASLFMAAAPASAQTISSLETNYRGETPSKCFEMEHDLKLEQVDYKDFLDVQSKDAADKKAIFGAVSDYGVMVRQKQLCLMGLSYGQDYKVKFKQYLPYQAEVEFSEDIIKEFRINDRSASVKFQELDYILPTVTDQKIPIEVVNQSEFTVRAYRLSDQVLAELLNSYRWQTKLSGYYVRQTLEENLAEIIGQETIKVTPQKNKTQIYNLDVTALTQNKRSGGYILVIGGDDELDTERWQDRPTQFLMISDIGVSAYQTQSGLSLYARSYQDAALLNQVEATLVAKNHDILDTRRSDEAGKITFNKAVLAGKAGRVPKFVKFHKAGRGFAYLDLTSNQLDLSDYDVTGRAELEALNAALYTERGVYRSGEEVVLSGLVRKQDLTAAETLPLTLKIIRPDGKEELSETLLNDKAGAFQYRFAISEKARTGLWQAELYLDKKGAALAKAPILIEDYVPATISATLSSSLPYLGEQALNYELQADFNYGAPASAQEVIQEYSLKPDQRLFSTFSNYVFGHFDDPIREYNRLENAVTDENGRFSYQISLSDLAEINPYHPMKLTYRASVSEPSGRPVSESVTVPVLPEPYWIGIKSAEEYPTFKLDQAVGFDLIQLDRSGEKVAGRKVSYQLIEEDWDYYWYRDNGWKYRVTKYDRSVIDQGYVTFDAQGAARLEFNALDWGHYRLEVKDQEYSQMTSLDFQMGWWNAEAASTGRPDAIQVALSEQKVALGQEVSVKFEAPYDGKLHLLVAAGDILEEHHLDVENGQAIQKLTASEKWGTGAYILATLYRPTKETASGFQGPARAIGISYMEVDRPDLVSAVTLKAPEKIAPNQEMTVSVASQSNEDGFVVLALVDEGILSLTDFKTPKPQKDFLAKKKLSLGLYDLYSHLIQYKNGETLKLSFGGDGSAAREDIVPPKTFVDPLVYVTDWTALSAGKEKDIQITLPQFNGAGRLMALYVDPHHIGAQDQKIIIRDPLVVQPILPRFIAHHDEAQIGVSLHNLDAGAGMFSIQWSGSSGIKITPTKHEIHLEEGEQQNVMTEIVSDKAGLGFVSAIVTRPDGTQQQYQWDLTTHDQYLKQFEKINLVLDANETQSVDNFFKNYADYGRSLSFKASYKPIINMDWLTEGLSAYPFGCAEQTTSKAWPIVLMDPEDLGWTTEEQETFLRNSFSHLANMQLQDGSFSTWRGGRDRNSWATMYVIDLLSTAKAIGISVPERMYEDALSYLKSYENVQESAYAYAVYLKTTLGIMDPGALRYYGLYLTKNDPTNSQLVFTALAFNAIGDTKRRDQLIELIDFSEEYDWSRSDYGSPDRDKVLQTFLFAHLAEKMGQQGFYQQVTNLFEDAYLERYISTQEKAWLIRVGTMFQSEPLAQASFNVNEESYDLDMFKQELLETTEDQLIVTNLQDKPIYLSATVQGTSVGFAEANSHKMHLSKKILRLKDQTEVMDNQFIQGEDYLVVLEITPEQSRAMDISLVDPLPAGFELENPKIAGGRDIQDLMDVTEAEFAEYRDDKFMAAWSFERDDWRSDAENTIKYGYIMKAVTAGRYFAPATLVENMYLPIYRANSAEGEITIDAKP